MESKETEYGWLELIEEAIENGLSPQEFRKLLQVYIDGEVLSCKK